VWGCLIRHIGKPVCPAKAGNLRGGLFVCSRVINYGFISTRKKLKIITMA